MKKYVFYGYKVVNGKIEVDDEEAKQIKEVFDAYVGGESLTLSGKKANLPYTHSMIKSILKNQKYIGDENYPAIVDKEIFDKAKQVMAEKTKPSHTKDIIKREVSREFVIQEETVDKLVDYQDPFEKATYLYSLIKCKEVLNE